MDQQQLWIMCSLSVTVMDHVFIVRNHFGSNRLWTTMSEWDDILNPEAGASSEWAAIFGGAESDGAAASGGAGSEWAAIFGGSEDDDDDGGPDQQPRDGEVGAAIVLAADGAAFVPAAAAGEQSFAIEARGQPLGSAAATSALGKGVVEFGERGCAAAGKVPELKNQSLIDFINKQLDPDTKGFTVMIEKAEANMSKCSNHTVHAKRLVMAGALLVGCEYGGDVVFSRILDKVESSGGCGEAIYQRLRYDETQFARILAESRLSIPEEELLNIAALSDQPMLEDEQKAVDALIGRTCE